MLYPIAKNMKLSIFTTGINSPDLINSILKTQRMLHILFIDDDSNSRLLAKLYLERKDYKVHTAKNTQRARDLLNIIGMNLIISDIGMPKEDGIEFVKWLKKEDRYKNIPVFLISAHASNLADLDPHSDVEFFEKPLFFLGLVDRIEYILSKNKVKK
ncbi:MAG: response regulator [Calditrichaceae bacterium]